LNPVYADQMRPATEAVYAGAGQIITHSSLNPSWVLFI
jgi:hypothetical protein